MVRAFTRQDPQLLEQLEAGVIVADTRGDVVAFNAGAERILGIPAEDAVGRQWSDLLTIVYGEAATVRNVLAAAGQPGGWHGLVHIRVTNGGSVRVRAHVQRVESPLLETGRGFVAVFWQADDGPRTPDQPPTLRALPYRALFHRSSEAVVLSSLDGGVLDANDAAANLFSIGRDDIVGRSFREILTEWSAQDAELVKTQLHARGSFVWNGQALRKGEPFPLEISGTLLLDASGEYLFARLRELSHERRLERMIDDLGELARLSEEPQDVRDVSLRALDLIADSFGAQASMLLISGPDGVRTLTGSNSPASIRAALGGIDGAHSPLVAKVAEVGEPFEAVLTADAPPPPWAERLHALGMNTTWALPVLFRDGREGAIVLLWRAAPAAAFDAKQLGHMGRLAGVAIGNAELREEMRREAERRSTLEAPARIGGVVMAQMSDAIVTTGRDRRITAVNPAAERRYGVSLDEVVGRRLEDALSIERLDGTNIAREIATEALSIGYWQGRVLERPRLGSATGRSTIADLSLTMIRDDNREPIGLIALSREVTASARLESEAAALSSLAVATGRARTRREVADAALERLCEATSADMGMILALEHGTIEFEASRGLPDGAIAGMRELPVSPSVIEALEAPGVVLSGDPGAIVASEPGMQSAIARTNLASALLVGLRVHGETIGLLALGSRQRAWTRPSDDVILQAAGQVAAALENARLMERLEDGLRQERQITAQLETLIGLTQLPEGDITEDALGQYLLERVIKALEAVAGFVVTRAGNRFSVSAQWNHQRGELESRAPETFYFWRRLKETGKPFFVPIDEETITASVIDVLHKAGFNAYCALPIFDGPELVAAFVCHFPRPPEEAVPADDRTLDAVSRIINIAHANVRMSHGLAEAVEQERGLAAELRGLQELTLLGSTTDDIGELSRETIQAVVHATEASGGGYVMLDERTGRLETIVWIGAAATSGPATAATPPAPDEWAPYAHLDSGEAVCTCAPEPAADGPTSEAQAVLPLRVDGQLVGVLQLQWAATPTRRGLDLRYLGPIARIASISLANFRLRSELLQRAAAQRSLNSRLDALDELTRIGEEAASFEELAHRTVSLVRDALGAHGVCYLLVEPGHHFETHAVAGETSAFRLWLKGVPAREAPGGSVLLSGGSSVLGDFVAGKVSERVLPLARATGFRSFGAIPIRVGEELAGALLCFFERPAASLTIDEGSLDSVARIAGIALANFRLRERLVSSEERYRTLFEESPEALLVSALDGTVLDANEAAVRLYRVNRGEMLGRYFGQLIAADEREMARRRQIVWAEGRGTFHDRGRRVDSSEFPMELELRVVELGGQRRFLALVRDLSDQERLQRELLQAQKMEALGQLVSGVAHELNNPLAAIIAFSQLLRRDARLPDDMKHDAGLLVQEADRTRRIVQNLLDFARARPPERRPTRIATLVGSVLELQSYALATNNIDVDLDIPDDLPEVDLDRAQLQQVLLNLTINAIQAIKGQARTGRSHLEIRAAVADGAAARTAGEPAEAASEPAEADPATPEETLESVRRPESVLVSIADDGPGVPEGARAKLFDPFFTTKQPGEGTGLGLSVSFGIVAAHGGRLSYEPGPEGRGSRFCIELPVHAAREAGAMQDVETIVRVAPSRPDRGEPGAGVDAAGGEPAAGPPGATVVSRRESAGTAARRRAARGDHAHDAAAQSPTQEVGAMAVGAGAPPAGAADSTHGGARTSASSAVRPRVLVLDDEPSIRAFLGKALGAAGLDCAPFQDGGQALEAVSTGSFDVMLIDHRMAGMSGTDFYDAAIRMRPDLAKRAVFMSGDVLNPDLRGFATQRGIRLLAKPFDIDAVTRVVREVIALAAAAE